MTTRARRLSHIPGRRTPGRRTAGLAAPAFALATLAGCANATGTTTSDRPPVDPPLATSVTTSSGTWAVLPMGKLSDPQNTFWQLLHRPSAGSAWVDEVASTATATTGGLVMAAADNTVTVGTLPSDQLRFSPLIQTSNGGRNWSNGLVGAGLAPVPDALATGSGGQALALVPGPVATSRQVLTGHGGDWKPVVTSAGLGGEPTAAACGVTAIEAVAIGPGGPLVGTACRNPGVAGIFQSSSSGSWQLAGPSLKGALADDATGTEVLALSGSTSSVTAVLSVAGADSTAIVPAWQEMGTAGSRAWQTGPVLPIPARARLESVVEGPAGQVEILATGPDGQPVLNTIAGPEHPWRALPAPPGGTETVSADPGGGLTALSVHGAVLIAWSLPPNGSRWTRAQTLSVPIEYGSSS